MKKAIKLYIFGKGRTPSSQSLRWYVLEHMALKKIMKDRGNDYDRHANCVKLWFIVRKICFVLKTSDYIIYDCAKSNPRKHDCKT